MMIGVVLTCFNRRQKTLAALEQLFASTLPTSVRLRVYLTDAASPDGTAEAVVTSYPAVRVIAGDRSLFWNSGMRYSLSAAFADGVDFVLWLNDDTMLKPTAINDLLDAHARQMTVAAAAVIVGTTHDAVTSAPTYGGVVFPVWWKRTTPQLVDTAAGDVECETLNGNIVLIPRSIYLEVGNLDPAFAHGLGDFDYGFRARSAGFQVIAAKGVHGCCSRNSVQGTFQDTNLPFQKRWALVLSPKGRPWKPWAVFTRRHCGKFWFLYWMWPYFYTVASTLLRKRTVKQ
jgi:GT2 family glycosyltransferase